MAVIGIGTNSRASVEEALAIVAAAEARLAELRKAPSPQPSPARGEGAGRARSQILPYSAVGEERVRSPLPLPERGRGEGEAIGALACLDRPGFNTAVLEAARRLGLNLIPLTLEELRAAAHLCATHSEKSMQRYGIPSIAEAAALAAAGPGARLLLPRFCGRNTTASVAAVP